jgi:hypothetical protein
MKRHYGSALALLVMIVFAFGSVDTDKLDKGGGAAPGGATGVKGGDSGPADNTKPDNASSSDSGFSFGKAVVTKAHYDQLKDGMSYRQVVGIIGAEGEELSRNKIEGVPGVTESIETVMYMWQNGNGTNMNAMFQNDKLMQKSQFGLK